MTRLNVAAVLSLLVALYVTAAGLPHVHADEGVRVGAPHLGHGDAIGDGSCVMPPLDIVAASACLACAVHAPQLTAPADATVQVVVPATRRVAEVRQHPADSPRPSSVRVRGPPLSA